MATGAVRSLFPDCGRAGPKTLQALGSQLELFIPEDTEGSGHELA